MNSLGHQRTSGSMSTAACRRHIPSLPLHRYLYVSRISRAGYSNYERRSWWAVFAWFPTKRRLMDVTWPKRQWKGKWNSPRWYGGLRSITPSWIRAVDLSTGILNFTRGAIRTVKTLCSDEVCRGCSQRVPNIKFVWDILLRVLKLVYQLVNIWLEFWLCHGGLEARRKKYPNSAIRDWQKTRGACTVDHWLTTNKSEVYVRLHFYTS